MQRSAVAGDDGRAVGDDLARCVLGLDQDGPGQQPRRAGPAAVGVGRARRGEIAFAGGQFAPGAVDQAAAAGAQRQQQLTVLPGVAHEGEAGPGGGHAAQLDAGCSQGRDAFPGDHPFPRLGTDGVDFTKVIEDATHGRRCSATLGWAQRSRS